MDIKKLGISVIITTKNRPDFLDKAIESVQQQTYNNVEIIVVDDGSSEVNLSLIKKIISDTDDSITLIENGGSFGACYSRNVGIKAARGPFITGLDDDDLFVPERLEVLMKHYKSNKVSLVCSLARNVDTSGLAIKDEKYSKKFLLAKDMLMTNYVGSQCLFKKQDMIDAGLFDESFLASQDHEMWTRMILKKGPGLKVNDYLYLSVQHDSHDRVSDRKIIGLLQFYRKYSKIMSWRNKAYNLARGFKMLIRQPSLIHGLWGYVSKK